MSGRVTLVVLALLGGCAEEERHARVVVSLAEDVVAPVSRLQVVATLEEREETASLGGGELSFPADFVVLLGDGHGALAVAVTGLGPEGAPVATGRGTATVEAGGTGAVATLEVVLGGAAGSVGCGDGVAAVGELCYSPAMARTTHPPGRARAADLDDDGLADVIAAIGGNDPGRGLSVARALGGDEFEAPVTLFGPSVAGAGAADVVLGDLNGDGAIDAVVSTARQQAPLVALGGTGPEPFGMLSPLRDPGDDPAGVSPVLADLDGDGQLDLCTMGRDALWVGMGDGDGTFTPAGTTSIAMISDIAVADLAGDADLEIVASTSTQEVMVFDRALELVASTVVGEDVRAVTVAELDGATPAEIVLGVRTTVRVLHVDGDALVVDGETDMAPGHAVSLEAFRLDAGRQGVAALVDEQRDALGYLPAVVQLVPAGGRDLEVQGRAPVGCWNGTMSIGDLEGDGVDEALVTCEANGVAIVRTEALGGPFVQAMRGAETWWLAVGEMDGDGRPDAVLVPWEMDLVRRADVPNATDTTERLPESQGGNIDPTFADFTGDERDDLASLCDEAEWCAEGMLKRWTATVGGAIEALPPIALPSEPEALTVAHVPASERVRLVVGMVDGSLAVIDGESGEIEATATGVPTPAWGLAAGTLDHGAGDDVVAVGSDGTIAWFVSDGAGGFEDGRPGGAAPTPSGLALADLDDDGIDEILVTQRDSRRVQVLWLDGDALADAGSFDATSPPLVMSVFDLDADGDPEVLLGCTGAVEMWNLADAPRLRKTLVGFNGYANAPIAWPRTTDADAPVAPVLFVTGQPDLGEEGWRSYVMTWLPRP